jgi:creatinine amidohydrolase
LNWYRLEEMIWQQVQEIVPDKCDLIFLPVGTVEAHGSAAIGTDNIIPRAVADYLGERFGAIVAPCVNYGITRSLYGYAGSLTIKPENFKNYIYDILQSLHDKRFRRVVIINGHGGNNAMLKDAAYDAFFNFGLKIAVLHWWTLCADITQEVYGNPGGHAGQDETGFVMAIDPKYGVKERYDSQLAYTMNAGADIIPVPGSVLIYDKDDRGEPDFDVAKGKVYAKKVMSRMGDYLDDIFARWQRFFPEK